MLLARCGCTIMIGGMIIADVWIVPFFTWEVITYSLRNSLIIIGVTIGIESGCD